MYCGGGDLSCAKGNKKRQKKKKKKKNKEKLLTKLLPYNLWHLGWATYVYA